MKIQQTRGFYELLLKSCLTLGAFEAIFKVCDWEWVSSQVQETSLFLAFKGNRHDAFDFIPEVLSLGCRVVVIRSDCEKDIQKFIYEYPDALFVLEAPLSFLKRSAHLVLNKMPNLLKIGITGSNGKTTTKEILSKVLSDSFKNIYFSKGNLNSLIGMCLSILQMEGNEEIGVFEMGINHPNDMDDLVNILKPQISIITNLSLVHAGLLGDFTQISYEKAQILKFAQVLICRKQDFSSIYEANPFQGKVLFYDKVPIKVLSNSFQGQHLLYKNQEFFLPLLGNGVLQSIRIALLVADFLRLSLMNLEKIFSEIQIPEGRMQFLSGNGPCFLFDAYNASLSSLNILLDFLKEQENILNSHYSRKFFIFAGFKEMGTFREEFHIKALNSIMKQKWNTIFLIGKELKEHNKFQKNKETFQSFSSLRESLPYFKNLFIKGDFVVLKGARSFSLEKIIDLYTQK